MFQDTLYENALHQGHILYQIFNYEYCISSVLIGSFNIGYQLMFQDTLYENALHQLFLSWKKIPNIQVLMKVNKIIIPFALVRYENG